MKTNDLMHTITICVWLASFLFFCGYGATQKVTLINSAISLCGSTGSLVGYAKAAYPKHKEDKN
jgi:hypothetical protein